MRSNNPGVCKNLFTRNQMYREVHLIPMRWEFQTAFCRVSGIGPTDCVEVRKGIAVRHCSIFQNSTDLSAEVNMAVKWQISTSKHFPFLAIKLMFPCCQKCWKIWRIEFQTFLGIFIMKNWKGLKRKESITLMLAGPQTEYTLPDLNTLRTGDADLRF